MEQEIGGIEVVLALNDNQFKRGLSGAENQVKQFGKTTTTVTKKSSQSFSQGFKQIASQGKSTISGLVSEIPLVGNAISGLSSSTVGLTSAMGALGGTVAGVAVAGAALVGLSLGAYFTGTVEGADKMNKEMNRMDFLIGAVQTKFQQLGKTLSNFLPDISFGDLLSENQLRMADELSAKQIELNEARRSGVTEIARLEQQIAEDIFKTRELDRPYAERKAALEDAEAAINRQFVIKQNIARLDREIEELSQSASESSREELLILEQKRAAEINLETQRIKAQKEIQNRQNEAFNAEKSRLKQLEALEKKRDDERVSRGLKQAEIALKNYETEQAKLADESKTYQSAIAGGFAQIGEAAINSAIDTETAGGKIAASMAQVAVNVISSALGAAMANAIVGGTQSGNATGPAAVITTPAFIASQIGLILGAFASIPSFASGGVYRHSEAGQSEIITPLNRVPDLVDRMGGNGNDRPIQVYLNSKQILSEMERQSRSNYSTQGNSVRWQ